MKRRYQRHFCDGKNFKMKFSEISFVLVAGSHLKTCLFLFVMVQLVIVKSSPPVPPNPADPNFTIKYLIKLIHPSVNSRKYEKLYSYNNE